MFALQPVHGPDSSKRVDSNPSADGASGDGADRAYPLFLHFGTYAPKEVRLYAETHEARNAWLRALALSLSLPVDAAVVAASGGAGDREDINDCDQRDTAPGGASDGFSAAPVRGAPLECVAAPRRFSEGAVMVRPSRRTRARSAPPKPARPADSAAPFSWTSYHG